MAGPNPHYKKLADFVAHGGNVTCLALGHISGRVLATGGTDRKVNLWAIGKPNRILSLNGHSTAIQCVRFGHTESHVYAGSSAGALMTWDLEAKCVFRTLTGHKSSIKTIDFHPYGDFISSGCSDTLIKLWDIRRKGCLYTYRGHTGAVNSLKFSPDGNWLASAGHEGIVKLWDLRMGKMLYEFSEHSGPVMSIEFHPRELLIASASQDNTVNFWDLERFTLVSSTDKEVPNARCLHFNSNGEFLYAGVSDNLRVYGWEPARTLSTLQIPWGNVHDLTTTLDSKLIGASFHSTNVSVWLVDPSFQTHCPLPDSTTSSFSHSNPLRKSFTKVKPTPEVKRALTVKTIEESERSETDPEDENLNDIPNVEDYHRVFQPSRNLNRSPPICIYAGSPIPKSSGSPTPPTIPVVVDEPEQDTTYLMETITLPDEPVVDNQEPVFLEPTGSSLVNVVMERRRSISPHSIDMSRRQRMSRDESMDQEPEFPVKLSSIHHSSSETNIPRAASTPHTKNSKPNPRPHGPSNLVKTLLRETKSDRGSSSSHGHHNSQSMTNVNSHVNSNSNNQPNSHVISHINSHSRVNQEFDDFIPMPTDRPTGLIDFDEFVPRSYQRGSEYSQSIPEKSEAEVLSSMMRGNESLMVILDNRGLKLQTFYSLWQSQDLKAAAEAAVSDTDPFVMADFLRAIISRPNMWSLDICVILLPTIHTLLQSTFESHMKIGCDALRLILKNFSPVIKTNVLSGPVALGVDITREERYEKCIKCFINTLRKRNLGNLDKLVADNTDKLKISKD
ncbi:katanin p80 WD40 repeat-containing subunit B1 isoform X2 [Cimex lectularius]|uniref:Katanin p80 WD40 repeat-containing subunit B1 n=1 Tax=Cimex lectularius TaxID=79782 RepID=A0A8I6SK69_CIMLE|nr:katanin p80 WD40 repeat-containing subunit B1 isoform X2 [Cimex lectularius]